jgi:hypothetical protein
MNWIHAVNLTRKQTRALECYWATGVSLTSM